MIFQLMIPQFHLGRLFLFRPETRRTKPAVHKPMSLDHRYDSRMQLLEPMLAALTQLSGVKLDRLTVVLAVLLLQFSHFLAGLGLADGIDVLSRHIIFLVNVDVFNVGNRDIALDLVNDSVWRRL